MRRAFILLLVSLFLSVGSTEAFADHHDKGGPRHEQRDKHGKKHNKDKKNKHAKKGKRDKDRHHGHKDHRPGYGAPHYAPHPRPGRPGGHYAAPVPPPPPPRLPHMVKHITKGCHDVDVWQIDHDTYIVKYRKGKRYYTRRIYPYADRYGSPSLITVNWQPLSPWTLIPPIQLNINL